MDKEKKKVEGMKEKIYREREKLLKKKEELKRRDEELRIKSQKLADVEKRESELGLTTLIHKKQTEAKVKTFEEEVIEKILSEYQRYLPIFSVCSGIRWKKEKPSFPRWS